MYFGYDHGEDEMDEPERGSVGGDVLLIFALFLLSAVIAFIAVFHEWF